MKNNEFEKRMEMLKKSYDQVPSAFDKEEVFRKIEEESPQMHLKKNSSFKQNATAWVISIASIFIIGILSAAFLLSDTDEQAIEGEITEQFLLQLKESYKEEREKRKELLKMDEERFAEIPFIRSADRAAVLLASDDNLGILSGHSDKVEILREQFNGLMTQLILPSEMIVNLIKHPLTDSEEASIEFMTEYRQKVNALISVYDDALFDHQKELNRINAEKNSQANDSKISRLNRIFTSMVDGMSMQNIRFLENEYMEFTEASYEIQGNYNDVINSLHENVIDYYDMQIEESTIEKPLDQNYFDRVHDLYKAFSATRDQSLLKNVAAVEIVGLYFYTVEIGDYDTQYDLYVQDDRYIVIDKKEHLSFSEDHPVSEEDKMINLFKGVSFEAKRDIDGILQGVAKLFVKPGTFSDEEEEWKHFSMMKTKFGWRVHFMPMQ
ncbi:hypothetical protein [Sporosarcina sp. FA9]|uniref:hypothetical protein n=1 Tax=Sporosarcina sp. FA9 TaxID=3413030 RepID=UPI003F65C832